MACGLVLLSTSACSPSESSAPSTPSIASESAPVAADTTPAVGDCWWWDEDYEIVNDWRSWEADGPVDCAEPHKAETFTVGVLTDAAFSYPDPAAEIPADMSAAIRDACGGIEAQLLNTGRVNVLTYIPSADEWEAGARWVRCDLVVRDVGLVDGRDAVPMTTSAEDIVASIRAGDLTYRLCVNTPNDPTQGGGPYADRSVATVVECDGSQQWTNDRAVVVDLGDAFPGDDAINEYITPYCDEAWHARGAQGWWAFWPSQENWTAGFRVATCWTA